MVTTTPLQAFPARRAQRGVALIVALILLMVLTMIAVVAMRTTTLDLKITANQTIAMRNFQASEAGRTRIHEVLEQNRRWDGWPVAIGGTLAASTGFSIPSGILVNGLPDLQANPPNHWDTSTAAVDMRLRIDVDGDSTYVSTYDMASDIFVTFVKSDLNVGNEICDGCAQRTGGGVAGGGGLNFYRIVSVAGGGNATVAGSTSRSVTDALFRYVIN